MMIYNYSDIKNKFSNGVPVIRCICDKPEWRGGGCRAKRKFEADKKERILSCTRNCRTAKLAKFPLETDLLYHEKS